jgi:hypothetical protein
MAINDKLIIPEAAGGGGGTENQEEGLQLLLDASDVDSYDGDGDIWYDIANFEYTPATNVSEHFNTVTWSGNGSSSRSITEVGFVPDLVWVKAIQAQNHTLYDSVRGTGKYLASDTTSAENSNTTYGQLTSFDTDGFTGSLGSNQTYSFFNSSSQDYVAWCFKAGGAAVLNEEGDVDSQVSANNDLGFSIVKGTGSGSGLQTVGHGLNSAPELVIIKRLDTADNWWVYSKPTGVSKFLWLDTTAATATWYQDMVVNSTEIGLRQESTGSWGNLIAYCFTSKRGVSKVGSYVGNGSTSTGNTINLGFEPAFIMIKNTTTAGSSSGWFMIDNKRNTSDPWNKYIFANNGAAEATTTQSLTSVGATSFTVKSSGRAINYNGDNYIYYAVAKNTNETSLIPDTNLDLHLDAGNTDSYSGTGTTWSDLTSNGNNGTITGATWERELGNSFEFDGSGDVVTTLYDAPTGAKTMEVWFNAASSYSSTYQGLLGGSNEILWIGGNITSTYSDESIYWYQGTSLGLVIREGEGKYLDNKWHHLAIVDTGSSHKMYVDGKDKSFTYSYGSASARITWNNLVLGRGYRTTGTDDFTGNIGQVRVYDAALTAAQVRQNLNFTKPNYPNGFNGTISGATWNSSGYFDFDGSGDSINLGSDLRFDVDSSIALWINPETLGGYRGVLSKWQGSSPYGWILNQQNNGNLEFFFYSGSTFKLVNVGVVSTNSWSHIVITYDGNNLKAYLNNTLANTTSNIGSLAPNNNSTDVLLFPAAISGITTQQWNGKFSKVKMYDKALTQTEITALVDEGY